MFSVFPVAPSANNTLILHQFVPLKQLHNIGHVNNTGVCKSIPTVLKDCPCDLLIVIANASLTGNCL